MAGQSYLGKLAAASVTLIGAAAGVVAIVQYIQSTPKFDVSGAWTIENTTQQTSFKPFAGLRETFKVNFTQNGTQFTGVGEKWSDDGKAVTGAAHTPIEIAGTMDASGRIHATFTSKGEERESSGGFDWQVASDRKSWSGTFTSTAADSSGPSMLRR